MNTSRSPSPLRPVRSGHVYSQNARADKILETVVRRTGARTVIPCTRALALKNTLVPPFGILKGGVPRARHPGAGIVRPPKPTFFKTDQTPLELGKGNGKHKGKYRHKGLG